MRPLLLSAVLLSPFLFAPLHAQQKTAPAPPLPEPPVAERMHRMEQTLQDWPNLARYREANEQLSAPTPGEQRVVFLGDSITDGWGHPHGQFFPGKPYINRGISGQTTPQMLDRFQQDVIRLRPAAVVILAGINDIAGNTGPESLEQIEDNFRSMATLAQAAHIHVILASVLPASYFPWRPGLHPAEQVRALNLWLEAYALQTGATFLNYYPALATPDGSMRPELATDKAVHPNDAGYALMQPLAEAAIAKALAPAQP